MSRFETETTFSENQSLFYFLGEEKLEKKRFTD